MEADAHLDVENGLESVRIVAYVDPPLVSECFDTHPNDQCLFPGFDIEYIYTIINSMLGYKIQWIKVNSSVEVASALDENKADVMGQSEIISPKFYNRWVHPPAFAYDSLSLLARERYVPQPQAFILFRCFGWDLWSVMLMFTVTFALIQGLSMTLNDHVYRFKIMCAALLKRLLHNLRTKFCFPLWFILIAVLLNFYSNLIVVNIVTPDKIKVIPFKSLPDLGEKLVSKKCQLIMLSKYRNVSEVYDVLINPTESEKDWAPLFAKAFLINPPLVAKDRNEMVDKILNTSSCLVGIDWLSMDSYYSFRYCDIRVLSFGDDLPPLGYTYYTVRTELKVEMSSLFLSESIVAYRNYLNNKYYLKGIPVDCTSGRIVKVNPINIKKMQDCFYLLLSGFFIALCFGCLKKCGQYKHSTTSRVAYEADISVS